MELKIFKIRRKSDGLFLSPYYWAPKPSGNTYHSLSKAKMSFQRLARTLELSGREGSIKEWEIVCFESTEFKTYTVDCDV